MTRLRPAFVVGSLLALAACGEEGATRGWAGTVDTLPSGRVLIRNLESSAQEPWALREVFRVGSLAGDPATVFGEIRDVELGPDGSLFVLDGQATEIRVFGEDGAHRLTFGREGEGPGELLRVAGMTFGPDGNLWLMNWGNTRYSVIDPTSGSLVAEHRRLAGFATFPWPGLFLRSGRLVDTGLAADGNPAILVLDSLFSPRDTLPMPAVEDARYVIRFLREGRLMMTSRAPFAPEPDWAGWPAGGVVYSEGDVYRLHYVDAARDTVMTVEIEREPIPVTGAEADSALAMFGRLAEESGVTPERQPEIPAVKAPHGLFFVDGESRTWVRRTARQGEGEAWDVIGADGRLLSYVPLPAGQSGGRTTVVGDRLALVTDVSGVPTVIVYELTRPGERPAVPR